MKLFTTLLLSMMFLTSFSAIAGECFCAGCGCTETEEYQAGGGCTCCPND